MSAFAVQNKTTGKFRGVVTQGGSKERRAALGEWRSMVRDSVFVALRVSSLEVAHFVAAPLAVEITFRLARPASHYGTGKNAGKLKPSAPPFPITTPDVDKLARATLDALKGTAFDDDSRVVDLHPRKIYAAAGELEGARIRIRLATAESLAPILALVPSCVTWLDAPGTLGETMGIGIVKKPRGDAGDALGAMVDTGRKILDDMDRRDAARTQQALQLESNRIAAEVATGVTPPTVRIETPEEKKRRSRERIQRVIGGTPIVGEIKVDHALRGRKGHALERHTPRAATLDDIMTDVAHAQAGVPLPPPTLDDAIARGDRGELARRLLACEPNTVESKRLIAALSNTTELLGAPAPSAWVDVDDFGGPDL